MSLVRVSCKATKHYIEGLLVFPLYRDEEETTPSTTLEGNRCKEDKQEKNPPENDELSAKKASDTEKEEGNYEELVCLVRQFYVERPVNPAAIAYQNIETC